MKIACAEVFRYRLPLRTPLVLRDVTITEREGCLLKLTSADGAAGWGEAAPLPGFSEATLDDAAGALCRAATSLTEKGSLRLDDPDLLAAAQLPSVSFALEGAVLSLAAAATGQPLCHHLTQTPVETIQLNALLLGAPDAIVEKARGLAAQGYRSAKLKVGRGAVEEDVDLVHEVRKALGPDVALRLDANQAWELNSAIVFGRQAGVDGIDYIEEPLADPTQLRTFAEATGLPYALDESYAEMGRHIGDPGGEADRIAEAVQRFQHIVQGAKAVVWKPTLMHFPRIAEFAARTAFGAQSIVISAAFESGVGLALLAHYAAAFSGSSLAAGLDTYAWLAEDVLPHRLPLDSGTLRLADLPPILPDESRLDLL